MKSYVLYCDLRESVCESSDSFSYVLVGEGRKESGVCGDLKELIGVSCCKVYAYTLSAYDVIYEKLEGLDFELYDLRVFLGLPESWGLYEVFSCYFCSDARDVLALDMMSAITYYILTYNIDMPYVYCVVFGYDFSWFCLESNTKVLGGIQYSGCEEVYGLGSFFKVLRYRMAKSGCCGSRVRYLTWDCKDLSYGFQKYLPDIFSITDGIDGHDYQWLMRQLSTDLRNNYVFAPNVFISALSTSNVRVGADGNLLFNDFSKDYSSCVSGFDKSRAKWGIILDCEGNKENKSGLRELGGIIFCRSNDIIISMETFECPEILLEETLIQVIKSYEVGTGRYIPARGIDIITFGSLDEALIEDSLRNVSNKQFRHKIKRMFRYRDCRSYISNYIASKGVDIGDKRTLSHIAKALGVKVILPKHRALADARTLFNVLAYILQDTKVWISN